jgi:hypothetical protein
MMVKSLARGIMNTSDIDNIISFIEQGLVPSAQQPILSPKQDVQNRDGADIIRMKMAVMSDDKGLA